MAQYQKKIKVGLRWFYKFDYQGTTYRSNAIYLSKFEAKRAEGTLFEQVATKKSNPTLKPILSLSEAIIERLDILQVKKSEKYYNESKRYLKELLQYIGDVPINKITRSSISSILLDTSKRLQEKDCDNYVVNAMIRCYKALFNQAIDGHELEMRNPCDKIDFYSIDIHLKYIPSDSEVEKVLDLCNEKQRFLFEFVRDTAARIGESLKMKGKDILEKDVILHTRKSKNSNLVPRKVPKPQCLIGKTFQSDESVFPNWKDTPKFLDRKLEVLQLPNWNWHNLRHRKASQWSNEGKPLYEIMTLLGHSSLKTTQRYLQLLSS